MSFMKEQLIKFNLNEYIQQIDMNGHFYETQFQHQKKNTETKI